jgi:hypothetical protein
VIVAVTISARAGWGVQSATAAIDIRDAIPLQTAGCLGSMCACVSPAF